MNDFPGIKIDWSPVLKSPLVLFLPVMLAVAGLTWASTEALSFRIPSKYRPSCAMLLGPALGWVVNRLEILDFGWGPDGWGRALFFGFLAGVTAVLAHDHIKDRFPFSLLTRVTPSAPVTPPPAS